MQRRTRKRTARTVRANRERQKMAMMVEMARRVLLQVRQRHLARHAGQLHM